MAKKPSTKSWYGVRCVFAAAHDKPWGPRDLQPQERFYEERVTLWHAKSFKKAIALAEVEARIYAENLECEYTGLAQAFRFDDKPKQGTEVFSLLRRSTLDAPEYLDHFFDTGAEVGRASR
ncbi:hypothetical protein ASE01_18635 [Nocardioides sp. Root190]|uniref:hypothetical protein n=1 Tax=Nocardioides sp. Root190 TaxID=1736488 RepID=UPI0006F684C1|nr:hypothetical protein [Nocardioides sp. Root190]KRB74013.1 hypothetical protein ASE01_18635 [Nocardioides sp. Root190]